MPSIRRGDIARLRSTKRNCRPAIPSIRLDQLGFLATVAKRLWIVLKSAGFALFGGSLLDRLGARRVLLPAIAVFTAGVFIFASARSFGTLAIAQLVLALGAFVGFVYSGGQWFGMDKFSPMFALVQCAASLFSAFNQNVLALAVAQLEWRELCAWAGLLGVAVFAAATVCIRNPYTFVAPLNDSYTLSLHDGAHSVE